MFRLGLFARRLVARLLDAGAAVTISLFVVAGLDAAFAGFEGGEEAAVVFGNAFVFVVYALYEIGMVARRGQTVGKMLARVVVRNGEEALPGWKASALRYLPVALLVTPGFGWALLPLIYLYGLAEKDGRGMHDLLAGTRVVAVHQEV